MADGIGIPVQAEICGCQLSRAKQVVAICEPFGRGIDIGFFGAVAVPATTPSSNPLAARAGYVLLCIAFGAAFWSNTRRIQGPPATRVSILLLVLQLEIGLAISTDFLTLVALQAPLVLSGRAAVKWIGAQLVAVAIRILVWVAWSGPPQPLSAAFALSFMPQALTSLEMTRSFPGAFALRRAGRECPGGMDAVELRDR